MLKKIALSALFVAISAVVAAGPVRAHIGAKKPVKTDVAPKGFCWPPGMGC